MGGRCTPSSTYLSNRSPACHELCPLISFQVKSKIEKLNFFNFICLFLLLFSFGVANGVKSAKVVKQAKRET